VNIWGEAISRTLGYPDMEFFKLYAGKLAEQSHNVIEGDIVGGLVITLAEAGKWKGTASDLLSEFRRLSEDEGINIKARGFPQDPKAISRRMRELKQNFLDENIVVEFPIKREGNRKIIKIYKKDKEQREVV